MSKRNSISVSHSGFKGDVDGLIGELNKFDFMGEFQKVLLNWAERTPNEQNLPPRVFGIVEATDITDETGEAKLIPAVLTIVHVPHDNDCCTTYPLEAKQVRLTGLPNGDAWFDWDKVPEEHLEELYPKGSVEIVDEDGFEQVPLKKICESVSPFIDEGYVTLAAAGSDKYGADCERLRIFADGSGSRFDLSSEELLGGIDGIFSEFYPEEAIQHIENVSSYLNTQSAVNGIG